MGGFRLGFSAYIFRAKVCVYAMPQVRSLRVRLRLVSVYRDILTRSRRLVYRLEEVEVVCACVCVCVFVRLRSAIVLARLNAQHPVYRFFENTVLEF